jgi:glycosyltransferase involved in cell wall biosynthesis
MRLAFISTRLAGTDGVSLETAKLAVVLAGLGHECFYCAGELDQHLPGQEIPEMHFQHPNAVALGQRAFGTDAPDPTLATDLAAAATTLKPLIRHFLQNYQIDYVIVQNAFAIPMQLPLAQALSELMVELGLPGLAHNHDFYWERERFRINCIPDFLGRNFPPDLPGLQHAVINSLAQEALHARRGLESILIPNVFDFATPPPGIDDYNADFRRVIGLREDHRLILQPTRVVPRKGIELAIELVARLADPRAVLVIPHYAGDEGLDYLHRLQALAEQKGVDMRYVAGRVDDRRGRTAAGEKVYSLWDVYPHADMVTYPSLVEGFGNALLEAVYFRRPVFINRYAVYAADIAPLGFQFAEIDGEVTDESVQQVRRWLDEPATWQPMTGHNYTLAQQHFSYQALTNKLEQILPV